MLLNTEKPDLTDTDAAAYLGVQPSTLKTWRCTHRYNLPFYKVGWFVRYKKSDLDAFIESRRVVPCR